ncbi:SAM-dependent methyltransferase [Virgibacillus indicus]|uniref:tRNA 5-hydroxyuridine methyltransferase n=1 Tax=Virgibacillus indicus TaxID=2024554 RepID=A0A265NEJ8_9BACI|nr:O-methyltransferase [Virgibacillus indicus]OZU89874.1 SAM-dependent methyltransferase [Virgibacillus indicus]
MDEQIINYLQQTLPEKKAWVMELENQAKRDNVPIMDPVSMNFTMQLIRLKKPKKILEIGTAIGYSALRMLEAYPDASITTIEKDEGRYHQAIDNINKQNKEENITVILGDALEKISDLAKNEEVFDFIFIDAAKGQYKRFFELASPLLDHNGLILSDNVLFRGHVAVPDNAHPRHKKMVEKIRQYNELLVQHPDFTTSIVPIGDGIAISLKNS